MKKFVFDCDDADIKNDFQALFNVDLDDEKYSGYENIESRWNAVVSDIYGENKGHSGNHYYREFFDAIMDVCMGYSSPIMRPADKVSERIKKGEDCLSSMIDELIRVIESYTVYEPDVWMNAFLSIKYYGCKKGGEGKTLPSKRNNPFKGSIVVDKGVVTNKGQEFRVPFFELTNQDGEVFEKYIGSMLGNNIEIFNTEFRKQLSRKNYGSGEEESKKEEDGSCILGFRGYKKRITLTFYKGKRYDRWFQKKILELEREQDFLLTDRILFYKTINGVLCRNMLDTMIYIQGDYDIEDYLYLAECLCSCMSLSWQNLIACLFIIASRWGDRLSGHILDTTQTLYSKVMFLFEVWISDIDRINFRLSCLSKGLVYLILKYEEQFSCENILQRKAEDAIHIVNEYLSLTGEKNNMLQDNARKALHTLKGYLIFPDKKNNEEIKLWERTRMVFGLLDKYLILSDEKIVQETILLEQAKKLYDSLIDYFELQSQNNELQKEVIDACGTLKHYFCLIDKKISNAKKEEERKKQLDNEWMNPSLEFIDCRMKKEVMRDHKSPCWMYAILQRHVIDSIKNLHDISILLEPVHTDFDALAMRVYRLYTDYWRDLLEYVKQSEEEGRFTVSPAIWNMENNKKEKYTFNPEKNNMLFCELAVKAVEETGQDKADVGEKWKSKLKESWIEQYPDNKLPDEILNQMLERYSKWIGEMEKWFEKRRLIMRNW